MSVELSGSCLSRKIFDTRMPPAGEQWRLFIDLRRQQKNDPYVFDHKNEGDISPPERGYFQAMSRVFGRMREELGKRYDVQNFIDLHDRCVDRVFRGEDEEESPLVKGAVNCAYYRMIYAITESARREWKEEQLMGDFSDPETQQRYDKHQSSPPYVCFFTNGQFVQKPFWWSQRISTDELEEHADEKLTQYYREISRATTADEKLSAIVRVCRALEVTHIFSDGNQRTIAFALLTKLLLENGFSPAILNDPYMFDGYLGIKEMVAEVKRGFANFYRIFPGIPHPQVEVQTLCYPREAFRPPVFCARRFVKSACSYLLWFVAGCALAAGGELLLHAS